MLASLPNATADARGSRLSFRKWLFNPLGVGISLIFPHPTDRLERLDCSQAAGGVSDARLLDPKFLQHADVEVRERDILAEVHVVAECGEGGQSRLVLLRNEDPNCRAALTNVPPDEACQKCGRDRSGEQESYPIT